MRNRPTRFDGDGDGGSDRSMDRCLRPVIVLPVAKQCCSGHNDDRTRNRRGKQRNYRACHTPQEPPNTRAKSEKIGSWGKSSKCKTEREIVVVDPPLPIEKLTMQDRNRCTASAQGEVSVSGKGIRDLCQTRSGPCRLVGYV